MFRQAYCCASARNPAIPTERSQWKLNFLAACVCLCETEKTVAADRDQTGPKFSTDTCIGKRVLPVKPS